MTDTIMKQLLSYSIKNMRLKEIVNGIWYNYYEKNAYQERHDHIAILIG